ncbi:MAG: helix-turn-helix transcriptional regulator [Bosea sp. (in: a-proteobacteria)]|uniref:PadR family transcriptional regulator n=1 Tax=Bosea sp. (in: a-proteobacteria) TaxID=1871050 RepID=UPI0027376217|nr:helix-turn-helix transcriptional regulator [Bosea sp. (in: a-proteobacteria)]MDP3254910.1 helix-turn-helix transcriptional regulator [Bosea sp. (in: a-proteobacteria)]MDP3320236.1 helix-turn-helix transcriptional regulator [Bosea sp. (in: a-proteobacteria)]
MKLFGSDKASKISLDGRDIAILEAVKRGRSGICTADILAMIEKETGKEIRLATVYNTVLDLEKKGLIKTSGSSSADNGGRPRRLFSITSTGNLALTLGEEIANSQLEAAHA